jgi:LPS sulfotransferase NodH
MISEGSGNPILITGSHRSGSTWLASMLALTEDTLVAYEPFNIEPWAYALDGLAERWFTYAPALPQDAALQAFEYLDPYRAEIKSRPEKIAEQAAIIWKCIYGVLFAYLDTNANRLVRKHEVLSSNLVAELRKLCKALGLEWTETVEGDVVKYTRSGNPVTAPEGTVHQIRRDSAAIVSLWKEILTKEEIAGVYTIACPLCDGLYTDEDWGDFSR